MPKLTLPIFYLISFFMLTKSVIIPQPKCNQNCQSCSSDNAQICYACKHGFQPTLAKGCMLSTQVENCMMFNSIKMCVSCKPSFRLVNRVCVKMSDGCLIAGNAGTCDKCVDGGMANQKGQCLGGLLNCRRVASNLNCLICQFGYQVQNGKCVTTDPNCILISSLTGLCTLCRIGYTLIGYQCFNSSWQQIQNCYLVSPDMQTCIYCKNGYEIYLGKCYPPDKIDNYRRCLTSNQYFNTSDQRCRDVPASCLKFDYGFFTCVLCSSNNVLIMAVCRHVSLKYCDKLEDNQPNYCQRCYPRYYVASNKLCQPFPPFCLNVSEQKCTQCASYFQLNQAGRCQDPNCEEQRDSLRCLRCKKNYAFNQSLGICIFVDENCQETGPNYICKKCKINYIYDAIRNICEFKDPNCKIFSDKKQCLQCRMNFYLSKDKLTCIQMPPNCAFIAQNGQCEQCNKNYTLDRRGICIQISNCLLPSRINSNQCLQCKNGYYLDAKQNCMKLPFLCQQFDFLKKICIKCQASSTLRNGVCYDDNCLYFGDGNQCLGCKNNYVFGVNGQCKMIELDRNCKIFATNVPLCRVCADRYYFDENWQCTNVSQQCQKYDQNNGNCLSCYSGFALQQGQCIPEISRETCEKYQNNDKTKCQKCKTEYILSETDYKCTYNRFGCIQRKNLSTLFCVKCADNYVLDKNGGFCIKAKYISNGPHNNNGNNNGQSGQVDDHKQNAFIDPLCVKVNKKGDGCQVCAQRCYLDMKTKRCVAIDSNCKKFNDTTGECYECYDGYSVSNKMICVISKPKDANCKIFYDSSDICKQCYKGYSFSNTLKLCTTVQLLCQTTDQTTGNCLTCYSGYTLNQGQCILQTQPSTPAQPQCSPNTAFDLQLKKCESPRFGFDKNCIQYRNRLCTKCKQPYILEKIFCKPSNK